MSRPTLVQRFERPPLKVFARYVEPVDLGLLVEDIHPSKRKQLSQEITVAFDRVAPPAVVVGRGSSPSSTLHWRLDPMNQNGPGCFGPGGPREDPNSKQRSGEDIMMIIGCPHMVEVVR